VEYALILAFISVVAIAVLIALGNQVKGVFTTITSQISYAASSH
jgi:Flp pilus assembly pilin Flp